MKVKLLSARGIHAREVAGIDALKERLPPEWYGFANLEMIQRADRPRQIDVVLVIEDRILIADLKDWRGVIKSDGQTWYQNDRIMEPSPAKKIVDNARVLAGELRRFLKEPSMKGSGAGGQTVSGVPYVQGCVILTNKCRIEEMPEDERQLVITLDDLCRALVAPDKRSRYRLFGDPPWIDRQNPLTEKNGFWRNKLEAFFGAKERFKPQEILYAEHRVCSDATFVHSGKLYEEFDVEEVGGAKSPGLLRRWDFSSAPTRYASEEARAEIAGREQEVIAFLTERAPVLESTLLRAKARDHENSIRYWEIFEKRRQLRRLREFLRANTDQLTQSAREDLIRSLLDQVATMHRLGAAHCDLGSQSIWLELPSSVRLSHLLAAHYPQMRTIGPERFTFLANDTVLPETHLGIVATPFQKDVFLLGVASHELAFGVQPHRNTPEDAPSWRPEIDHDGRFRRLHGWFEKALALDADQRFPNAQVMLDAFNEASGSQPISAVALERLERFRKWPSIMALARDYPFTLSLREEGSLGVYRADRDGETFLVKYWSPMHVGDLRTEATRLLAFFDRADDLATREIEGVCSPIQAGFAGDNVVLIQRFIAAPNLTSDRSANPEPWQSAETALRFTLALCETVERLHEVGAAHGDVSPTNILVVRNESGFLAPILVDVLDLAASGEGELRTPAYAPPFAAEATERDRYGVLRVADELIADCALDKSTAEKLRAAMETCRSGPPPLAALSPLAEAISEVLQPKAQWPVLHLRVPVPRQALRALVPDDGVYHVVPDARRGRSARLLVAGANAELSLELERASGLVRSAVVKVLPQSEAAWRERKSIATFVGTVEFVDGPANDLSGAIPVMELPEVRAWLAGDAITESAPDQPVILPEDDNEVITSELSIVREDLEAGADASPIDEAVDIAELWRTLLKVEAEQFTRIATDEESFFSRKHKRHLVRYTMLSGTIDYDPDEPVQVEVRTKMGDWRRLGRLDVERTTPEVLAIDTSATRAQDGGTLLNGDVELRLVGLREADSRNRRQLATDVILERRSGIPNLVDYFTSAPDTSADGTTSSKPNPADPKVLAVRYGLNSSQASALADLWTSRPLGLLQGPPGTGKTTFIAALVHHALTAGGARNVLLASQSHEAVNNAGEAILKLFRRFGDDPSLIRVGQEGNVSELLLPFHSARVETRYRDEFRARLREKLLLIGGRLAVSDTFLDTFFFLEATVQPILRRLAEVISDQEKDGEASFALSRVSELRDTVLRLLHERGLPARPAAELSEPEAFERMVYDLAEMTTGTSREQARRVLDLAELCRDWLNSVSSRRRNFESFLVGTRQIVCGTCVGLGRSSLAPTPGSFDLVVIDEAARCTASELAIPMQAGRWVVLVGDQTQLEPHYDLPVLQEAARRLSCSEAVIRRSDFERAFGSAYGAAAGRALSIQYRMLPAIGRLVSHCFYGQRLDHGRSDAVIPQGALPQEIEMPLLWVDTSGRGAAAFQSYAGKSLRSLCNESEADAIADMLRRLDVHAPFHEWLAGRRDEHQPIGIICMYSAQRELVRRKIALASLTPAMRQACKVETVDSYQGKENDIVILSLVRNNDLGPEIGGARTIKEGFMARANRINVAISRARDRLVIVGSLRRWPDGGPMANVADFARMLAEKGEATIVQHA